MCLILARSRFPGAEASSSGHIFPVCLVCRVVGLRKRGAISEGLIKMRKKVADKIGILKTLTEVRRRRGQFPVKSDQEERFLQNVTPSLWVQMRLLS